MVCLKVRASHLMRSSSRNEDSVTEELHQRVALHLVLVEEALAELRVQVEGLVVNGIGITVDLLTALLGNFVEHVSDLVGVLWVEDVPQRSRSLVFLQHARHREVAAACLPQQLDGR